MKVKALYIYPIKSLGGIAVSSANTQERGFEYDRRWMLVDEKGKFQTQRELVDLCHFIPNLSDEGISVTDRRDQQTIHIPIQPLEEQIPVNIWGEEVMGSLVSKEVDQWFSQQLKKKVQLVYMDQTSHRPLEENDHIKEDTTVSFADGFPYLILGSASIKDLDQRIPSQSIQAERFRPNIIIDTEQAFEEDLWLDITIGDIAFKTPKPCARCVVTTIDPDNGEKGKEPLLTLSTYRKLGNKILVGENAVATTFGKIRVGDTVVVMTEKEGYF
ncbi:MOSC domain-containing protein [Algivirga pacifica]|uniref:MOSC domain-containing protein n=1 Tax=Algivirga pacifica TaxID=1162670 RepID=A0ABP9CY16_9BACT